MKGVAEIACAKTNVCGICTTGGISYLFSSLGDVVRVTTMSQDRKQLEEIPSQGAWGITGLSVGAPACQEEALHFQTSARFSHSGFHIFC